jgi:hypothetical protein
MFNAYISGKLVLWSKLPDIRKSFVVFEGSRASPACPYERSNNKVCMKILTGEVRSSRRKTCSGAILSTTNLTLSDVGSNPGLSGEKPAMVRLNYGRI